MKKLFLLITILTLSLNCSDDDNNNSNENDSSVNIGEGSYVINNNETSTNYAYWYGGSAGEATFTLTNVLLNSHSEVWNNTNDTVFFDLRPQPNETINTGTYEFSSSGQSPLYIQDGGHNYDEFIGGTITIAQNGANYTVSYNINLQSGDNIIGNYNGAINIVE
ncbi:hypothetical protein DFQ09_102312 [Winogradskyella pacifica]|uniref:Uncharacterized protein n=1 Tax=Winogradskyella pacifica TaxID=664642 RepID=A0A3D9MZJ3_9FLAO|nr:hypothetical protein [Winogradskyella pacifica]REE25721.1 hypothetical protein DFQ09_102312 [Winogradskyella pacifica]